MKEEQGRILAICSSIRYYRYFLSPLSNCYNQEQREVCRVEQPPERGIIDAAREWVSTRSRRSFSLDCPTVDAAGIGRVAAAAGRWVLHHLPISLLFELLETAIELHSSCHSSCRSAVANRCTTKKDAKEDAE
nr:hypothetical protein Iba_chr03cCG5070 [Ipomoea batatas]